MTSQWDVVMLAEQDQLDAEAREVIRQARRLQRLCCLVSAAAAVIVIWNRW